MNVQQKVQTLEALLARVQKNAALPRASLKIAPAAAPSVDDSGIPAELLAATVMPSSPVAEARPVARAVPEAVDEPSEEATVVRNLFDENGPESKPRLMALAPPITSAQPARTSGVPGEPRAATPRAPQVSPTQPSMQRQVVARSPQQPTTPKAPPVAAKPAAAPAPAPSRPAAVPGPAAAAAKTTVRTPTAQPRPAAGRPVEPALPDPPPGRPAAASISRQASRTLMGTGLEEMQAAIRAAEEQVKTETATKKPVTDEEQTRVYLEVPKELAEESTLDGGATAIRKSPFDEMGGESTGDEEERTRLMESPEVEPLRFASSPTHERPSESPKPPAVVLKTPEPRPQPGPPPFQMAAAAPPATTTPFPQHAAPMGLGGTVMLDDPAPAPALPRGGTMMMQESAPPLAKGGTMMLHEPVQPASPAAEAPPSSRREPPPMPAAPMPEAAPPAASPAPAVPSFMQEAAKPAKKKSSAGSVVIGLLVVILLVGGGVFAGLRFGYLDPVLARFHITPPAWIPMGKAAGTSAPKAAPSASARASAPATTPAAAPSAAPAPPSAQAAAPPSAQPSATPSATPSAAPSAAAAAGGDPSSLPAHRGYFFAKSALTGTVFLNGRPAGAANEQLEVDCGMRFASLGTSAKPGGPIKFVPSGRSVNIKCRGLTEIVLPGPLAAEPAPEQ